MQCNILQYCIYYITDQNRALLAPKRAILGNRCQKTAHRAAERAPTGKPKVSRVYQKSGLYGRSVEKNWFLGQKCNFWAKNAIFGTKSIFFPTASKFLVTIMKGHQKSKVFVSNPLNGGRLGGQQSPFFTRKSLFFYATPILCPFFWVRRIRANGIISPPYPHIHFPLDNISRSWLEQG